MSVAERLRCATSMVPSWISSLRFEASAKYLTLIWAVFGAPSRPS